MRRTSMGLLAAAAALSFVSSAMAQLVPDRLYYGKDRPAPMTVTVPAGAAGEVEIQMLEPVTAKVLEKATAAAGPVDLAKLFPSLWTNAAPKLAYAQLVVGGKKIGPAVVIQPMISPPMRQRGQQAFEPQQRKAHTGFRAYVDKHVVLDTTQGEIEIELRPDVAPNTAYNWMHLVEGGFYTDIVVHRIVTRHPSGKPFVIQFGDPNGQGDGGPGYNIDLEPPTLPHDFGVVSMARTPDPNTGSSQVFICLSREATKMLDNDYTSFAQAVRGGDVIQKISAVPVGPGDRPTAPMPAIKSAKLVDAPPYGEGPKPVTASGDNAVR